MTALSIRHQRFTLRERETEQARQDAERFMRLPENVRAIKHYYWHIKEAKKRSLKFVCDFYGSEEDMAKLWARQFGTQPNYRLICFDTTRIAQNNIKGQS